MSRNKKIEFCICKMIILSMIAVIYLILRILGFF